MPLRCAPSRRRPTAQTSAGFTLVELVLTVVIVGMLSAMAVPRYAQSVTNYRVDAAARRLIADIAFAQQRADARSKAVVVAFNLDANTLTLAGVADLDHPDQDYQTALDNEPYRVTLVSADFAGSTNLQFTGYGRATSGGTIVLRAGDNLRTLTIDADTGEASLP